MPNASEGPKAANRELVREEFRRARMTDAREREPAPVAPSRWHELAELGQSVWYDNVARPALRRAPSGGFERLIAEDHVTGGTSNPSIFAKAVLESDLYDAIARVSMVSPSR